MSELRNDILKFENRILNRRLKKLEETLSFYANEKNYDSRHGMAILKDCGDKAREGLK